MSNRATYKGFFKPKNPKKYTGDPTNIIYRSLWERKVMAFLDMNESVIEWSSEEIVVPYISPIDQRKHRYFPDFIAKIQQADGTIKTLMLEVKPYKETIEPKKKNKTTQKFLTEVKTWGINQAKWKYAKEYCADRGWEFKILTEHELGIK